MVIDLVNHDYKYILYILARFVRKVLVKKEQSWRDDIAYLVLKVTRQIIYYIFKTFIS